MRTWRTAGWRVRHNRTPPRSVRWSSRARAVAGRLARHHPGVLLQACLNGARRPSRHPTLPVTPAQLAADAVAVASVGAEAVHLHVKDAHGADTPDGAALGAVLEAVRAASRRAGGCHHRGMGGTRPGRPAGRRRRVDGAARLRVRQLARARRGGRRRPAGGPRRRRRGGGCGTSRRSRAGGAGRTATRCLRALLELPAGLDEAATAEAADALLTGVGAGPGGPSSGGVLALLHGAGSSAWPAVRHAGRRRVSTRIGLEDTLELPDGSPAPDNAALVRAALAVLPGRVRCGGSRSRSAERAPSGPDGEGVQGGQHLR